jgi:hypothetical protein
MFGIIYYISLILLLIINFIWPAYLYDKKGGLPDPFHTMSDEDRAELKIKYRPFIIIISRLASIIMIIMLVKILASGR